MKAYLTIFDVFEKENFETTNIEAYGERIILGKKTIVLAMDFFLYHGKNYKRRTKFWIDKKPDSRMQLFISNEMQIIETRKFYDYAIFKTGKINDKN